MTSKKKFLMGVFGALSVIVALAMAFGVFAAQQRMPVHASGVSLTPRFAQMKGHFTAISASRTSSSPLATWSSSFDYNNAAYPYTMVGTDPTLGDATTTVPVTIIPLTITFSNGKVFKGASKTTSTKNSPLFKNATYSSGITQYGDAMQRAEFWNSVGSTAPNYHVLLGTPTIAPAVSIKVPAAFGNTQRFGKGKVYGQVDLNWFDAKIQTMLSKNKIAPNMLPIFLTYNVFLTQGGCCVIGYHSVASANGGNQTYVWGTYNDPGIFTQPIEDIDALSHEVSEWMNDPYITNTVPNWSVPSASQYGCSNLLEDGDPLVGTAFNVKIGSTTYHPQDEAFFSWFARQSPSIGINGYYTYLNSFNSYSPSC